MGTTVGTTIFELMASVIFKVRGKSSIYFRFRNGREIDVTMKLPYVVNSKDWSDRKQQFKNNALVNNHLNEFKAYLLNEVNNGIDNQEIIDSNWVKGKLIKYISPEIGASKPITELTKFIQLYIDSTKPNYASRFLILKEKLPPIKISQIDTEYLVKFTEDNLSSDYSESYTAKQIQRIRQVLRHAEKRGHFVKREVFDFKAPRGKTISTYLNNKELEIIFNYKFNSDRLENVKKLFLVGCTTGLRVSDLMQIKCNQITDGFLEIESKKTKQQLLIPIAPQIKKYITNLKPISDQKFNKYLKELCHIVGIDSPTTGYLRNMENKRVLGIYPKYKLITSHTMRRSFATNLYGKVPTVVIMAITGHTTEKSFLTYIKKPQRDFAEQLKQYYLENY